MSAVSGAKEAKTAVIVCQEFGPTLMCFCSSACRSYVIYILYRQLRTTAHFHPEDKVKPVRKVKKQQDSSVVSEYSETLSVRLESIPAVTGSEDVCTVDSLPDHHRPTQPQENHHHAHVSSHRRAVWTGQLGQQACFWAAALQ
ncbi:hypothetical protein ILYODFUR_005018 [Ilyodon furcidens]|uniref:Uncharacterized protein n=1 Tax=Ilyodon furcidens TaxID=33524 RepID=A0ABV0TK31_9TELE